MPALIHCPSCGRLTSSEVCNTCGSPVARDAEGGCAPAIDPAPASVEANPVATAATVVPPLRGAAAPAPAPALATHPSLATPSSPVVAWAAAEAVASPPPQLQPLSEVPPAPPTQAAAGTHAVEGVAPPATVHMPPPDLPTTWGMPQPASPSGWGHPAGSRGGLRLGIVNRGVGGLVLLLVIQGALSFVRAQGLATVHDSLLALGLTDKADYASFDLIAQVVLGGASLLMAIGLWARLPAAWYGTAVVAGCGLLEVVHLMTGPYANAASNAVLLLTRGLVLVNLMQPAVRRQLGIRF